MELLQGDPSGMSTPLGQLVIAATMLVVIVLAVRFLWERRNK